MILPSAISRSHSYTSQAEKGRGDKSTMVLCSGLSIYLPKLLYTLYTHPASYSYIIYIHATFIRLVIIRLPNPRGTHLNTFIKNRIRKMYINLARMGSILFIGDIYLRFSGFPLSQNALFRPCVCGSSCELRAASLRPVPIISYINAIVLVSNSGIRPGMYNEHIYAYM